MDISDYLPNYPDLNDPEFNEKIFRKKEMYELRTEETINKIGKPGDLWPHQELLGRFLAPSTPYQEILLFHMPGTGKTCAASVIAEVNKIDPLLRKPVLVIVPNDTLVMQWKQQIALVCTSGEYVPENYFSENVATKLTSGEKTIRINKLLAPIYHITTIERIRRLIDKHNDITLKKRFSGSLIIIDEAHNLRIQSNTTSKNVQESKKRYMAFHRFLHVIEGSKKVLLTGTPMFDRITELPGLLNLILPLDSQMPTGKAFSTKFLKTSQGSARKIINKDELYRYFVGRVSYIREGGNFPTRVDLGTNKFTTFLKTVNLEMSHYQYGGYMAAFEIDKPEFKTGKIGTGLQRNTRDAAVFVYKDVQGNYIWGAKAFNNLVSKGKQTTIKIDDREMKINSLRINDKYAKDIRDNLEKYSSKYNYCVNQLQKHSKRPFFIFTPLVSGTGGAIFFGLILELFGYKKALGNTKSPDRRYALITGDDNSTLQRKKLIEIYNSPENQNGEIIHVMIATKTISEGTSFINTQEEIVLSPFWNNSTTEQAIGRGIRANSLQQIPIEKRKVNVAQLCMDYSVIEPQDNIDAYMYAMSENKDYEIKAGERILKESAWDCPLNYDRNVRTNDFANSRNCDYQKCNYSCYQVPPLEKTMPRWTYGVTGELDDSTYLLYYAQPEILETIEKIKLILKKYSYINISGISKELTVDNFKLLLLSIEYMIENNIPIYNSWGIKCFLRNQGNMLFLSDTPIDTNIQNGWYTRFPFINDIYPLTTIINNGIYEKDVPKLNNLNLQENVKETLNDLSIETKIFLLESLILMDPADFTAKQKKNYSILMQYFENHMYKNEDLLVHDLAKLKLPDNNYIDYTIGENGPMRCMRNGIWENCVKKDEDSLAQIIKKAKDKNNPIADNKYGIYGTIETDGKFRIVDKTKEENAGNDIRKLSRGMVCIAGWKKWELVNLYMRLKIEAIPLAKPVTISDKNELIEAIKKEKCGDCIKKGMTVPELQKILTLAKNSIKPLCSRLQDWFEAKNLILLQE
jgi:superfamily II DNA or RNA helicase